MRIALFLPNWIGDAVMATPALRAIRLEYPEAEIVGVQRPYVADVLDGTGLVDRVMLHEPKGTTPDSRGWRFAARLRLEQFDLAVLFPNSFRSAWLAWCAGAKRRVGFSRNGRGVLLTDRLTPKSRRRPNPVLDEYLRLAEHLGCAKLSPRMELAVTPAGERAWDAFWQGRNARLRGNGIVCLNPGGAFGAAKHWPVGHFGQLAAQLADTGKTVLVLCGPAERESARQIVESANRSNVISPADAHARARGVEFGSLAFTKAAIRSADLLVTTDSGPRHFAPPFGVPVLTLFGPTHIAWSETYYAKARHLQLSVDCGPCQQRVCPRGHHRCMRDLSVERVFANALAMLGQTSAGRATA